MPGSPVFYYENDPYKDEDNLYFPEGLNQLTNGGKQRMFNVGLYLRDKYSSFLSDNYHEVEARSSDKDRCIESAQLVVNGAYAPTEKWIWNEEKLFQTVPVHTVPSEFDSVSLNKIKMHNVNILLNILLNFNYNLDVKSN